jgi:deoxyribose-phosphate aldolase
MKLHCCLLDLKLLITNKLRYMNFEYDAFWKNTGEHDFNVALSSILERKSSFLDTEKWLKLALSCIDLTTLDGNDHVKVVEKLCEKARTLADNGKGIKPVAAVCVYSNFVSLSKKLLNGTGINVACVAGGFPSGQGLIASRVFDVQVAVEEGADEIDIVFPRGLLFLDEFQKILDEIGMMREACKGIKLKVILETGELNNELQICHASELSIKAGADFIKTSTGKTSQGASIEAVFVMLQAIKSHFDTTGNKIGLKPSGGISDPETALNYLGLTYGVLGEEWMNNKLFRIGASRLADKIFESLS